MPDPNSVDLEASIDEQEASAKVTLDCPKCGLEIGIQATKSEPFKLECVSCGWKTLFSLKITF